MLQVPLQQRSLKVFLLVFGDVAAQAARCQGGVRGSTEHNHRCNRGQGSLFRCF
jgi:hypothetical protein